MSLRSIILFGFLCCFGSFSTLLAHQPEKKVQIHKAYVTPDNVSVFEGTIWISHKGNWFSVPNLASDHQGVYVISSDQWEAYWTCPRCGQVNLFYDLVCRKCGY